MTCLNIIELSGGQVLFIEMTDKEVLATTKASKVNSEDVEMWTGG